MEHENFLQLQERIEQFVNGPARAMSDSIEADGVVTPNMRRELERHDLFRLARPTTYGGLGLPFADYLELLGTLSEMHGSLRVLVHVANSIWRTLDGHLTEAQMRSFGQSLLSGERWMTFTLSEPNSGSGTDIRTTARRQTNGYTLRGEKWMIIFSDFTDYFLTFCRLEGTRGKEGTMALLVPRDTPGLTVEPMAGAMGITGTVHGHLRFDDCFVPEQYRIGSEGDGLRVAFDGFLHPSRTAIAMTCVGLANRALQIAVAHAKERVTFGKSLADRPTIQFWLAEMATDIEAARHLTRAAAKSFDDGHLPPDMAAMAKYFAADMLQRVTDKALQIHGGIGYFKSSEMERIYRDARMQRFEEGTAETQKMVIARRLLTDA
ncbi:MAG: acyl-CoA dehydrogenase [Alicyclobacillaceae bacterium]|jgi:alkylation response protein AidB-like acyl-CoA dehydrogenase|uniref:acyl-CoA dehydrogenase family protein n=1 Tax=Alicyclobacillus sp. SP_1 TaxID=2942475 RepID=UPI002157806B|nr:acyl-CoA dehydrogenase [Alicyclobacillus sp. SP_1]MCY0887016.1 acyl-CoA dehydrogenase [Alicyclobacillaceae bacterium]